MSQEAPSVEQQVYDQLAIRAQKHFGVTGLSAIAKIRDYDPSRPTHNFDNVFFEAQPSTHGPKLLAILAWALSGRPRTNHRLVKPFEPQVDDIIERLEERKVMLMTGHQTLFEPAWAALGLQRAIAKRSGRPYQEVAQRTHLLAARALSTVDVVLPVIGLEWPLTRVGQQVANIYYTFPSSENYRGDDSIPHAFQAASNARMLGVFANQTDEPGIIGVVSSAGTSEKFDKDLDTFVVPRVKGDETRGTMGVLMQDWDILPVGGIYKHGMIAEPGRIIPAEEVTSDVIHDVMESVIVASRNRHGVPAIYAEA